MKNDDDLNERGNRDGRFTQGIGGWAEYTVLMTEVPDRVRHDVQLPPRKVIPIIFLPGVMGSNLRMTKDRQEELKRNDNRAWRPDDMVTVRGGTGVLTGTGFGGWFKNARPDQRQLNFDPDETEVEYYHYTENAGRFDPEGRETVASDARHNNVPDGLNAIPPLLGSAGFLTTKERDGKKGNATPAQLARWRGWSEIMFSGAYGSMLKTTERFMNNVVENGEIHTIWRNNPRSRIERDRKASDPERKLMQLILQPPTAFGGSSGEALTEDELKSISDCWYPVHAMGYNFLKSNGECAIAIAERIRGLVAGYKKRHFECNEVIVVTHSMGGLLGRALLHPRYGNLMADKSVRVLGMYHSVMPTAGAAAAYKRMRFGFSESDSWLAEMQARLFGIDGRHATAILANTPGPLELLPADAYGSDWIRVVSSINEPVGSWPSSEQSALNSIYLQPASAWWRLVNPSWVNPKGTQPDQGGSANKCFSRIRQAFFFANSIKDTFHPTSCWVSYCDSAKRLSYGDVVYYIKDIDVYGPVLKSLPPPQTWKLLSDDARGTLTVQAGARKLTLQLVPPRARGDETVPSKRSAQLAKGIQFIHGRDESSDYEHQDSYSRNDVLASMLYAIVKIAKTAKWS